MRISERPKAWLVPEAGLAVERMAGGSIERASWRENSRPLTSLGFYDLAIAAPSMKAALEAWGADSNLFHQGVAKESSDPEVVVATMAKPGVILRRPVGSDGPFREHADLPLQHLHLRGIAVAQAFQHTHIFIKSFLRALKWSETHQHPSRRRKRAAKKPAARQRKSA